MQFHYNTSIAMKPKQKIAKIQTNWNAPQIDYGMTYN